MAVASAALPDPNLPYLPNSYPAPGNFVVWRSGPINCGTPSYFNSALSNLRASPTGNATLTIYLRVKLVKKDGKSPPPRDIDGKTLTPTDWPLDEWNKFCMDVKRLSEWFWDNTAFCLIPPPDYHGLDWPTHNPTHRLNVDCRFQLVWANGSDDAHAVVDCYRPDPRTYRGFRSSAGDGGGQWTSLDTVEAPCRNATCTEQVFKGFDADGILPLYDDVPAKPQITVCHEVGHLLGLPHVGEWVKAQACMAAIAKDPVNGGNTRGCYQGNNAYDRLNVMGEGMNLALWNAAPWTHRIAAHTGVSLQGWKMAQRKVPPRTLN
jgi:hypothetical protein